MKSITNLSKVQISIYLFLFCLIGVFGYLFYDGYQTNIQNRDLIADSKIENKDISQDLEIMKGKYEKLKTEIDMLKNKVIRTSYKKKRIHANHILAAGMSSKNVHIHRIKRVNYKKLYFRLMNKCMRQNRLKKMNRRHR